MPTLNSLAEKIQIIEERNKKVELDKAWETSWIRKLLLLVFTYLSISLYFIVIRLSRPWVNAAVPALGFWFSTLSLPLFRKIWERSRFNGSN